MELGAGVVDESGRFVEQDARRRRRFNCERFGIHHGGSLPILERVGLRVGRKKEGVLSAFRTKPDPFLAAKNVNMLLQSAAPGFGLDALPDQPIIHPSITQSCRPSR